MKFTGAVALTFAGAILFSASASAAPFIMGQFGTTGAGVLTFTNAAGTIHMIDFCPTDPSSPANPIPATCGTSTTGNGILTASGGTQTFASIISGVTGSILDVADASDPPFTTFTTSAGQTVNNFIKLPTFPTFNFQGNQIVPETCAPTATVVCIGGFLLSQVGNNVSVSFTVNGTIIDSSHAFADTPFTDVITGQFNNTTLLAVTTGAGTPAGIFSNTWSGSVQALQGVPEPGTMLLCGLGFLGFGAGMRRMRKNA